MTKIALAPGTSVTLSYSTGVTVTGTVREHFGTTIQLDEATARDTDMGITGATYSVDGVMYGTEGATILAAPSTAPAPVRCWACEDSEQCSDCGGHGEFYTNSGTLADCRNCNGHGVCLDCVETEEECFGGYKCLCQLQAPCTPTVYAA